MPQIKVKTSTGTVNFHYTISTPTNESAKAIDKNLPTLIFLHPAFIAQEIFQRMYHFYLTPAIKFTGLLLLLLQSSSGMYISGDTTSSPLILGPTGRRPVKLAKLTAALLLQKTSLSSW
jgi:hypothetical protein